MSKMNILYCGMADDILTPLLLVPNFDKLYVICIFDSAFALNGTFDGQKKDIINCLQNGNDKISKHAQVGKWAEERYGRKPQKNTKIQEKCKILNQTDKKSCWKLTFSYCGKTKELIYFHHTDFIAEWNDEIKDIKHIMTMGAPFPYKKTQLLKMLKERCTKDCKIYDQFTITKEIKKTTINRFGYNSIHINPVRLVLMGKYTEQ